MDVSLKDQCQMNLFCKHVTKIMGLVLVKSIKSSRSRSLNEYHQLLYCTVCMFVTNEVPIPVHTDGAAVPLRLERQQRLHLFSRLYCQLVAVVGIYMNLVILNFSCYISTTSQQCNCLAIISRSFHITLPSLIVNWFLTIVSNLYN